MPLEQTFIQILCTIGGSLALTLALTLWRRSKGKTSIFRQDQSLEDIGLSALSAALPSSPVTEDFRTVIRPPWGLRLGAPVIAAITLVCLDLTPLVGSLDWAGPEHARIAKNVIGTFLAYSVVMLLFYQRVAYDSHEIRSYGIDIRPQVRALSGLQEITLHPKRPALVLRFADQPDLYVPKFLSDRERFVASMEAIAKRNAPSLPRPRDSLRYRMGF